MSKSSQSATRPNRPKKRKVASCPRMHADHENPSDQNQVVESELKVNTATLSASSAQKVLVSYKPEYDLIQSSCEQLRDALKAVMDEGSPNLTVDLSKVKEIDGHGLAVLLMCQRALDARGGSMSIITSSVHWKTLLGSIMPTNDVSSPSSRE